MLQSGLTGLLLQRWVKGEATAGDVAFAITAFLVMAGYLRNVGENIRQMQRLGFSLKEMGPVFQAYESAKPVPKAAMVAFLEERLTAIRGKIEALRAVETYISQKLDGYRAEIGADGHPT